MNRTITLSRPQAACLAVMEARDQLAYIGQNRTLIALQRKGLVAQSSTDGPWTLWCLTDLGRAILPAIAAASIDSVGPLHIQTA